MPVAEENDRVKVYRWEDWLATGAGVSDEEIVNDAKNVQPGSCATLIYTSGTTVRARFDHQD